MPVVQTNLDDPVRYWSWDGSVWVYEYAEIRLLINNGIHGWEIVHLRVWDESTAGFRNENNIDHIETFDTWADVGTTAYWDHIPTLQYYE